MDSCVGPFAGETDIIQGYNSMIVPPVLKFFRWNPLPLGNIVLAYGLENEQAVLWQTAPTAFSIVRMSATVELVQGQLFVGR